METPTPTTPAGATPEPGTINLIPRAQNDLAFLGLRVTKSWGAHPEYELHWITQAKARQDALDFAAAVGVREDLEDDETSISAKKRQLESKMDKHLKYVKAYIDEHWDEDEPEVHFGKFGITETSAGWRLPADQDERVKSLKKLIKALGDSGLDTKKFGVAFWQPLLDDYEPLVTTGQDTAQAISGAVGDKNPLCDAMRNFLSRFNLLLEAQSPTDDAYRSVRREMGYLKEYNA